MPEHKIYAKPAKQRNSGQLGESLNTIVAIRGQRLEHCGRGFGDSPKADLMSLLSSIMAPARFEMTQRCR
jgi:hypothetical protein